MARPAEEVRCDKCGKAAKLDLSKSTTGWAIYVCPEGHMTKKDRKDD